MPETSSEVLTNPNLDQNQPNFGQIIESWRTSRPTNESRIAHPIHELDGQSVESIINQTSPNVQGLVVELQNLIKDQDLTLEEKEAQLIAIERRLMNLQAEALENSTDRIVLGIVNHHLIGKIAETKLQIRKLKKLL